MEQAHVSVHNLEAPPSRLWIGKLTTRIVSAIFCIVVIGVGASLAATVIGAIPFACLALGVVVGLCWDIAEIVCIIKRENHKGIHPGACVGVDLILWLEFLCGSIALSVLGYLTDTGLVGLGLIGGLSGYYDRRRQFSDSTFDSSSDISDGLDDAMAYIAKTKALLALGVLLLLIHFALFVIACVETHRRRAARQVVVVHTTTPAMQPVQQYGIQMQPVQGTTKGQMQPSVAPTPGYHA